VDLTSDPLNCGTCQNACPAEATRCSKGQCLLATFVAAPLDKPTLPVNYTVDPKIVLVQGSTLAIGSTTGGLSCVPKCSLSARSKSEYVVSKVANMTDVYTFKRGTVCLLVLVSEVGTNVIEAGCPSTTRRLMDRQDGKLMGYWTVYNSTGTTKILNANMDSNTGCIQVTTSGPVTVGSCDSPEAGQWTVAMAVESPSSGPSIGVIVGAAVAGVAAIGAAAGLGYHLVKKRKAGPEGSETDVDEDSKIADASAVDSGYADPYDPQKLPIAPAVAAMEPRNVVDLGKGSQLYVAYGGSLDKGIRFVDVKNFGSATSDYKATREDELSISKDDRIYVESAFSDGWALGTNTNTGKEGLFPADFIDLATPLGRSLSPVAPARSTAEFQPAAAPSNTISIVSAAAVLAKAEAPRLVSPPTSLVSPVTPDMRFIPPALVRAMSDTSSNGTLTPMPGSSSIGSAPSTPDLTIPPAATRLLINASDVVVDTTRKLGEGGFGVVHVGVLRGSNTVAVKTMKGDVDSKTMQAFVREVANWEGLVQRNGGSF